MTRERPRPIVSPDEYDLFGALRNQNPWWSTGKTTVNGSGAFKRRDFYELKKALSKNKVMAIVGPRRVGKTTTIHQLIQELIEVDRVDPSRILYTSFDYPYVLAHTTRPFEAILETYQERILKGSVADARDPIYLFLDEVYSLPDWARVVKGHFDRGTRTKVVISGSSAPQMIEGAADALVGRLDIHRMMELKFADVAQHLVEEGERVRDVGLEILRDGFKEALERGDPGRLVQRFKDGETELKHLQERLQSLLLDYLVKDGHPENLHEDDLLECANNISAALNLAIYKDIVRVFGDREPDAIEELFTILAGCSGQAVSVAGLAAAIHRNERTVERYISHLESVYLVGQSRFYSGSLHASARKSRKVYVRNLGARNAVLGMMNERLKDDESQLGRCAEIASTDHIRRLMFCIEPSTSIRTHYWTGRGDAEVDVVVEMLGKVVPFEVKFRRSIRSSDTDGLREFLDGHKKAPFGILLTRNTLRVDDDVAMLPLWLFLLAC